MFFEKMPASLNNAIKKFVKEEEGEKEIVKIPFKDDLIQNQGSGGRPSGANVFL